MPGKVPGICLELLLIMSNEATAKVADGLLMVIRAERQPAGGEVLSLPLEDRARAHALDTRFVVLSRRPGWLVREQRTGRPGRRLDFGTRIAKTFGKLSTLMYIVKQG